MKYTIVTLLSLILVLSFAACTPKGAKVTSSWVAPSPKGYGANNILVMGVSRSETRLKLFENVFVDEFQKINVRAMASYKVIGNVLDPDKEIVEAAIKATGASSVLFTRVLGRKSETTTFPGTSHFLAGGFYESMYGYYDFSYQAVYTEPMAVTRTTVRLESNLYDVETARLIWSAQSEAINPELLRTDFERFVDVLIADMQKNGGVR
ncbi:MAG: hypothetical protein GQ541_06585 [Desulfovibrionaceae bacterium]|nr:hypothetical protein [Desulfovibrionaceae bacterium]